MLMFHEGAECLEDVRHLHGERALAGLMGFRSLPCAATPGNGLRRVGRDRASRDVLQEVNRRVLEAALQDRDRVTLDIDASVVHAEKKTARRTDQGRRGDTPMVGHIAETGQVAHAELRRGSVPPAAKNRAFLGRCIGALPEGVRVSRFRADAASYQAGVIHACREHGACFAIRAKMDGTVRAAIAAIGEDAWQPMPLEDGSPSETESVARTVPVMGGTPEAFCLVVQRRAVRPAPEDPDRPVQVGIAMPDREPVPVDGESALDSRYLYRAMATDLDREGWRDAQIAWWYNRRADASENRTRALRSDFAGAHLPCSGFRANAVVLALSAIAYNLFCLMRLSLASAWHGRRAGTFRYRLYAMASQVVRHARQWTLKVGPARPGLLDEALWRMRTCRLF